MMPAMKQQSGLTLHGLLDGLVDASALSGVADIAVTGIAQDSRQVRDNDVFIAVPGAASHGLEYAEQAVRAGASVVLWDTADSRCSELPGSIDGGIICLQVDGLQRKIGEIASRFSGAVT